jgi:hypothetical protein
MMAASGQAQEARSTAQLIRVKPHRYFGVAEGPKSERVMEGPVSASPVELEDASIDQGGMGRYRSHVTVKNADSVKTITRIEWRVDVYDEQRRTMHDQFFLSRDTNIKPNASRKTDTKIGASGSDKAVLPERAIAVVQLSAVTYSDGSTWAAAVECKPSEDLKLITCDTKKPR